MGKVAIHIDHLGKQYHIGQKVQYRTLRDKLADAVAAPFKKNSGESQSDDIKGKFWALKDVSFDIEKGEVVGIIGRNGAGKSTLLKILSRITKPTEGLATIEGRVGSLLEVGTGFHPELTGRENIYLSGAILGMKHEEIDRKFNDIVKFAETEKFLDTPLKHYSSGMQVRLGFAVAAHLDSDILIIDEVLAVGDSVFQKKCFRKINDVSKEGRTILFVSHNMDAVERICTRVIYLESGQIKQDSKDVSSVIKKYMIGDSDIRPVFWRNTVNAYKNNWFTPIKFFITDSKGNNEFVHGNNSDIWINIVGEITQVDPALQIGYAIYSEEGNLLYWSVHTDGPLEGWPSFNKGQWMLKSKIPKRILNEGLYRIELLVSLYYREWVIQPGINSPSIYLTIQGGLSDSPYLMIKRPGIIAPIIEWEVSKES